MRSLIDFFVKRSVFANLVTFFMVVLGLISIKFIRREVFPNVNFDIITVTTIFPGASAEEVEKLITNPIERDLKEVDGIKKLQSISTESRSYIVAQLDPDQTTETKAKDDIKSVIDRITDLPEDAERPIVVAIESKLTPIIEVSLSGPLSNEELRSAAKYMEDEIESVPGVAKTVITGLRDREIHVEADPQKLARYRLSLDDLVNAIKRQNVSIPAGTMPADLIAKTPERIVRTIGDYASLEDLKNTVIRANDLGIPVRVGDVATAREKLEKATILTRTNGDTSINLTVLKKEKADAVTLVDALKAHVEKVHPTLDSRIKIDYVRDFSVFIKRRLSVLTNNMGVGICLIVLILSLILPFRVALVVSSGVVFSFLTSVFIFESFGLSINLISMLGLIIVSGMLVDDAIVVTDNSVRLMEEGLDPQEAAIQGTHEIWMAIAASVLTTMVAFVPMLFMSGIFGKFIRQIPLGVIIPLSISLVEAFFILPNHIATFIHIKKSQNKKPGTLARIAQATLQHWEEKIVPGYTQILRVTLRFKYLTLLGTGLLFGGVVLLGVKKMDFILFPPDGIEQFFVMVEAPTGSSLEETSELMKPIEADLKKLIRPEELESSNTIVGMIQTNPNDPNTKRGTEQGQIAVFLTPETDRQRTAVEIIASLRDELKKPEGLKRMVFERPTPGPPVGKPIDVAVRGASYDEIRPAVKALKKVVEAIPGATDIVDTFTPGKEEFRIHINPAEAAAASLSVASVGTTVRAAVEGLIASSVTELTEEVDIRVTLPDQKKTQLEALENLLIPTPQGHLVPLSRIATITRSDSISYYEHEANKRQIRLQGQVNTKLASPLEIAGKIRKQLPELEKQFPQVSFHFGGEDQDTQESLVSLVRAFGIAFMAIAFILILTFQNLLQPLLVMLTIPLGVIAVILTLFVHGKPLSFMAMLGIIALAGVIVNNAIIFVDFVNQQRRNGVDKIQSIVQAGSMRIRPIFLTTATTVAGLLPTAYGIGGLDKFVVPIALSLGWGLLAGSVLTAFVFPSAISAMDDFETLIWRIFGKKKAA